MRTGVIKIKNGVKETQGVFGNQFIYTRINRDKSVVEAEAVVEEVSTARRSTFEEDKQQVIEDILRRAEARMNDYRDDMHKQEQLKRNMNTLNRLIKEDKRKYAPKTKVQRVMDMVGIDRRKVYDMLCEVEKRMA